MKLEHEFYDLQDLEKRWSEYGLTEKDILKHGVSGKLQFSFRIPSGSDTFIHIYAIGNLSDGEVFICDEIAPDCGGSIYNISTVTVNDLFEAESNYIKNGIPSTVDLRLEIPCSNPKCKFPDRATNCNIVYSDFPLMGTDEDSYINFTGNRSDLIVTHENVLAFEKNHLKPEEQTLPYPDPTHDGDNNQLAESSPSTLNTPENNDAEPSSKKEKWPSQGELVGSQEKGKIDEDANKLLSRKEAAKMLGIRPNTLAVWATKGKGPAPTKVGTRSMYLRSVLDAYINDNTMPR